MGRPGRIEISAYLYQLTQEEQGLLLHASMGTRSSKAQTAYLAWLEAREDPRAEVLRLVLALEAAPEGPDAPAQRARLSALQSSLDPCWWWLMKPTWIRHCGLGPETQPTVRFRYECPRTWESLAPMPSPGVRMCDTCEQAVYHCASIAEAEERARDGACIAVPAALVSEAHAQVTRMVTGRPDAEAMWAGRVFPGQGDPEWE